VSPAVQNVEIIHWEHEHWFIESCRSVFVLSFPLEKKEAIKSNEELNYPAEQALSFCVK
jgi:hypothetical protein